MKVTGRLVRVDLGAGGWALETDDGRKIELQGSIPGGLAGQRVKVTGSKISSFGFTMIGSGTAIDVRKVEQAG